MATIKLTNPESVAKQLTDWKKVHSCKKVPVDRAYGNPETKMRRGELGIQKQVWSH
jgi:hypothetical protein